MSQSDHAFSEKRDFIRMRLDTQVALRHAGEEFSARCLDLSSTGMQLEGRTALAVGDRVHVHIASLHSELKGLSAEAQVVRVSAPEHGAQRLGLAILSMD